MDSTHNSFPPLRFTGRLRPSQAEVVEIARRKLADGQRRLHIVAPPGSGKTVLGLYLWAECVRQAAVVLSPNSAIQAQWTARADLFGAEASDDGILSTDPRAPGWLTSLTYQSVTLPGRGDGESDDAALELWRERLIEKGQAEDPAEADVWLADLRKHNPEYYDSRLSGYRKQVRDARAIGGEALATLHASARDTLERLRSRGVGLIILDECHHLMGHWGRVLADAQELLDHPIVVGLTATPPDRDGLAPADIERYDEYFGEVDYEVPLPAVVKDGFLAPYQDLAYFVRPTKEELEFIASADDELHRLVGELCPEEEPPDVWHQRRLAERRPASGPSASSHHSRSQGKKPRNSSKPHASSSSDSLSNASSTHAESSSDHAARDEFESLPRWVYRVLAELRLPTGAVADWKKFERRDAQFAWSGRLFLIRRNVPLPEGVPAPTPNLERAIEWDDIPEMEFLTPVLDRYIRHRLRRSPRSEDRELAEKLVGRLRVLGVQITETGCQACASPVGRVMAYSRSKTAALPHILRAESAKLGEALRAVVVADYEKTSATTAGIEHLLDKEAGGAVAAFKSLLADPIVSRLDPILVTGSSVLIDDDVSDRFDRAASDWLRENGFDVELLFGREDGFHTINGRGADWCPRVYVEMLTDLFQRGFTKCLVGTRGLLGEGWDANKVNVLVDLTTVTTSMTVNQLRGRSIRLDADQPNKLADNWDVVCIAPEFTKGLDDYGRFIAKHQTVYGVTDDGAVEKGVGHVHAAFTELRPELLEDSVSLLNDEMLARVARRDEMRRLWRIGEPYRDQPIRAVETRTLAQAGGGFPPFARSAEAWNARSLAAAIGESVLHALIDLKMIDERVGRMSLGGPSNLGFAHQGNRPAGASSFGTHAGGGPSSPIEVGERAGGYVRVFLDTSDEESSRVFVEALYEALAPLHRPRYVIPRYVHHVTDTFWSRWLPRFIGHRFQQREHRHAMLHAVPSAFARNRESVDVFQRRWNQFVSPGEAVFALRGSGEEIVAEAVRKRQSPVGGVHQKEIFL